MDRVHDRSPMTPAEEMGQNRLSHSVRVILITVASTTCIALLGHFGYALITRVPVDRTFMVESSCTPPCWQGINPGQTTRSEALEILHGSRYVRRWSVRVKGGDSLGSAVFDTARIEKYEASAVRWRNGVVYRVDLAVAFPLTAEQLIERFGPPEALGAVEVGLPEYPRWSFLLYYPREGIKVRLEGAERDNSIRASTPVDELWLFEPCDLTQVDSTVFPGGEAFGSSALTRQRPWKGYGDLTALYDFPKLQ
jgi:hypothetical protein